MPDITFHDPSTVDGSLVRLKLQSAGVEKGFHEEIVEALPKRAAGVILYGSVARGDTSPASDIDLLVVTDRPRRTAARGRVNVTTYDALQFASAQGTLYGMHISRDGLILHDSGGTAVSIAVFGEVEVNRLTQRLERLAALLELPEREIKENLTGFVRHARYVLRTATYLKALRTGEPCFSVTELSHRFDDPSLSVLLSSHAEVHGPPSHEVFDELRNRTRRLLQRPPAPHYQTLKDAIVGYGAEWPEVGDAATLILNRDESDPYATIPRVIL